MLFIYLILSSHKSFTVCQVIKQGYQIIDKNEEGNERSECYKGALVSGSPVILHVVDSNIRLTLSN